MDKKFWKCKFWIGDTYHKEGDICEEINGLAGAEIPDNKNGIASQGGRT